MAMKMREKNAVLEFREELEQTAAEKMAFKCKKEVCTNAEIKNLLRQRLKHWYVQAILVTTHVLKKYEAFPNAYVFKTYFNALLENWRGREILPEQAFKNALLLMEIFEMELVKKKPKH
jgi:hypothetical protein